MSEYIALYKYNILKNFIHDNSYRDNVDFNYCGSIHRGERVNLKCPECNKYFLMIPKNIKKNIDHLCPYCNFRTTEYHETILSKNYHRYFSDKNKEDKYFVSIGSHKLYHWECEKGHMWEKSPYHMTLLDNPCVECYKDSVDENKIVKRINKKRIKINKSKMNRKKLTKDNSKSDENIKMFDPYCGHVWDSRNIIKGHDGCPFCKIRLKITRGENDLFSTNPELQKDWSRKNTITPYVLTYGSSKRVIWECHACGYEWIDTVSNRTVSKRKCISCTGSRTVSGINDTATQYPEVARFWDQRKNTEVLSTLSPNIRGTFHWTCSKGHEFMKSISAMVNRPTCEICDGTNKTLPGINDLVTTHPDVVKFWDYEKNDKSPHEVKSTSGYDAWWVCEITGQSFQRDVYDFVYRTRTSPYENSSQGEKDLIDYIKSIYDGDIIQHSRKIISPLELDAYLPDCGIAFEFNGVYWHSEAGGKNKDYHYDKWRRCKDKGIQLISIWEDDWNDHRELVMSYIDYVLGNQIRNSVSVQNISKSNALKFMRDSHLDSLLLGYNFYGVYDNGTLVSISSWEMNENSIFINDYYCTPGYNFTLSDILNNIICKYSENIENVVFIDNNDISYRDELVGCGFQEYLPVSPSENYIYRSRRFSEEEISRISIVDDVNKDDLLKIWDCGRTMYSLSIES